MQAVHPRVCGEQNKMSRAGQVTIGSSPRVRGTEDEDEDAHERFIPACAGNRQRRCIWMCCRPVHPRVCGEQASSAPHCLALNGSSPRVRGTVDLGKSWTLDSRFIPACAGNRPSVDAKVISASVHPRVCGEQATRQLSAYGASGSSPRVRGTDHI